MGDPLPIPPQGFDELDLDEQMAYLRDLSAHVAASANKLPLHDWQRKLLEERLAEYEADPNGGVPWEDILRRVRASLRPE